MTKFILLGILAILTTTTHAFQISGQAYQYGQGTDWDFVKMSISPMSSSNQDEKGMLFGFKQAEWSRNCTELNCYLDLLLPLPELAETPWIEENAPGLGKLSWNEGEATLRGQFSKSEVLPKHWAQHKLGKELAITFAGPQGEVIGKSVKIRTLNKDEIIVWEINFPLLLKKLTEFRPVP